MEDKLFLIYAELVGKDAHEMYEYDFYFSENPESAWGEDWNEPCPAACDKDVLRPDISMYSEIRRLVTIIPFGLMVNNTCFSLQDAIDDIIPCAWEDISTYEEFPSPIRLVFHFGESFESVEDKLAQRQQFFNEKKISNKQEETKDEHSI